VERALAALGADVTPVETTSLEHARALARRARADGAVVAALGGDGLAGAVAGELAGAGVPLLVLPGGRGNDLARKLGVGRDAAAACALLRDGRERRIDLAGAAGRTFVGILSAGLDSAVQAVAGATRLPLGRLVYPYGLLRVLRTWEPARWDVAVDGRAHGFRGYSVAVANSGVYGGGMRLVPDAELDDGLLDVVLTGHRPRRRILCAMPRVYRGAHMGEPGFLRLRGREVAFGADRPFTAYADGDPLAPLPVTVRVAPGALRVLAP